MLRHTRKQTNKMRTKTLLLTAALSAAGLASSMAQAVYSVNAVGFVKVTVPAGFSMIANPLKAPTNTVGSLFADAPDGTTVYKYDGTNYSVNGKDFGEFANPTQPLEPGEGAFIQNGGTPFDVIFVGEVMQGSLSNAIPAGFSIKSSQVPQSAQLDTVLGFPAVDGDLVFRYNNATGAYQTHTYDFGAWDTAPVPNVGESFFVSKAAAANWTRTFNVNQ
jgi:hypothetical protein